jgi:hypothetical protein
VFIFDFQKKHEISSDSNRFSRKIYRSSPHYWQSNRNFFALSFINFPLKNGSKEENKKGWFIAIEREKVGMAD